jgi:hypothetical protein
MKSTLADITPWIDKLVSSTWMFLTFLTGLLMLGVFFSAYKPFRVKWHNYILPGFFFVAFIFSMIFLTRGPFGNAVEFIQAKSNGKQLALIETHEVGDGDGGTSTVYRLYTFDLRTGKRILRQLQSYSGVIAMTEKMIVFSEADQIAGYDIFTGEEVKVWSKEQGFESYPQLRQGISTLSQTSEQLGDSTFAYLIITAMDGNRYYLDVNTERLIQEDPPHHSSPLHTSSLTINENEDERSYYAFQNVTGEIDRLFVDRNGESKFYKDTFLEPEFIAFDGTDLVVIRHFETLEKRNAILTAVNLRLEKAWQITQQELIGTVDEEHSAEAGVTHVVGKNLITTFGGCIVCLDIKSGNIIWKTCE